MNAAALGVMLCYLAAIAVIAYFGAKRTRSIADFVAASGQLGFWTYCLLMVGSVFSGMTLIGVAGLAFTTGWANVWERIIGPPFAIAFGTILIAHKLYPARERGILTVQDYLAMRYDDPKFMRFVAGVISAITCFLYLIGQYTAIGVVSEVVLGIPYWLGAVIAAVIVVAYVTSGGMFSTAWTTFLQSILMISGVLITVPFIVSWVGGFEIVNQALANMPALQAAKGIDSDFLFARYLAKPFAPANVPLAGWLYNITLFGITVPLGLMVAPHIVNNMLTFRDIRYTRWSPLVMFVLGVATIMSVAIAGMAARAAWGLGMLEIPKLELGGVKVTWSDMAYPSAASAALPKPLFILLLPTILAGVMSTTDRLMVTAATNVSYDIVKNVLKPDANERFLRSLGGVTVVIIGFASLYLALSPPQLLAWFVWSALSLMANCFFFPIVLGIYWKGMTRNAARFSMLAGFFVTVATFALHGKTVWILGLPVYASLPGFVAAFAAAVVVSIIEGKRREKKVLLPESS